MTVRRCCCVQEEVPPGICGECPEPVSPCTEPIWQLNVVATNMIMDAAGDGAYCVEDVSLGCQEGTCGRVKYRRKALGVDTFALGVCDETEMCEEMVDDPAPEKAGSHFLQWTDCYGITADSRPNAADTSEPGEPVFVEDVLPFMCFNPATCSWTYNEESENPCADCRSLIRVTYLYTDSFSYPRFDDVTGCTQGTDTLNVQAAWECYYSRRSRPWEYFGVGQYKLVRCDYPAGLGTWIDSQQNPSCCSLLGGTVCSPDGLTQIVVPTLWQPPGIITLQRVC